MSATIVVHSASMGRNVTAVTSSASPALDVETDEFAEDNGFFDDFSADGSSKLSKRKRNRQSYEQNQQVLEATVVEDEVSRKERVEGARRKIAAAVLARASPREVKQAVMKMKKKKKDRESTEVLPKEGRHKHVEGRKRSRSKK